MEWKPKSVRAKKKKLLLDRQGTWPIVAPSFIQTAVREEGKGEAVRGKAPATLPSEVQIADLVFTNSWRQGRKLRKDRSCRLQSTVQPPIFLPLYESLDWVGTARAAQDAAIKTKFTS